MTDSVAPPSRVAAPPPRPLLVFDGDCGFCRYWIGRWRHATAGRVDHAPSQEAAASFPEIPAELFESAVVLIEPDGGVTRGAEAVFRALAAAPGRGGPLWAYRHVPGARGAAEAFYRFVAGHRVLFSRLTRWLWGRAAAPPSFFLARRALLSGLGIVYFVAFASLAVQITGLAGAKGILPAGEYLDLLRESMGPRRYYEVPSLAWLGSSDLALQAMAWGGAAIALLLAAGIAPAFSAAALWALYLSLASVCRVFMNFQWDVLLLEAGFLAIFLAPARITPDLARERPPSAVALFLFRWLLFRLMFGSGLVKLASGDPTWWSLTALEVHYETQPIPAWTSWFMHQLPAWFQMLSTAFMFAVELGASCLIFGPRRPKLAAFWALVSLQVLIAATGNYAFFNLLSIVLCFSLVDDASWPAGLRARLAGRPPALDAPSAGWRRRIAAAAALAVVIVGGCAAARRAYAIERLPGPIAAVSDRIAPFRSLNAYGLFASMTTRRPEIVVEGSRDGRTWEPYAFRWKPGDVMRAPSFVAPHQPRLDWQMWFAALSTCRRTGWFVGFLGKLLEGSDDVLALMETNPFPGEPPRYIRAVLYDYRFTDRETREKDGAWWSREARGLYCPVMSLREGS